MIMEVDMDNIYITEIRNIIIILRYLADPAKSV